MYTTVWPDYGEGETPDYPPLGFLGGLESPVKGMGSRIRASTPQSVAWSILSPHTDSA